MLVRNGRTIFQNPGRFSGQIANQSGNFIKGGFRNRFVGGLSATFGGYANGHLAPSSFVLPQVAGSISSYTEVVINIVPGTIPLTPAMPMVVNGALTISITTQQLDQIVQLAASGTLSLSAQSLGLSQAVGMSQVQSIFISNFTAQLGGIIPIDASGSFNIAPSITMSALANLEADIGGPTPLSPEGLAQAVWSALIADYPDAGTMGKALQDAGGAGNPWAALLASNQDPGSFGEHVQKLLTQGKFLGLKD